MKNETRMEIPQQIEKTTMGRGVSNSATIGAARAKKRPTKLQIPKAVALT
jgi:hypothetical protein